MSSRVCLVLFLLLLCAVGSRSRVSPSNGAAGNVDDGTQINEAVLAAEISPGDPTDSPRGSADDVELKAAISGDVPQWKDDAKTRVQVLDGPLPEGYSGRLKADGDGYSGLLDYLEFSEYFVLKDDLIKFSIELGDPDKLNETIRQASILQLSILSTNAVLKFCFFKIPEVVVRFCSVEKGKQLVSAPEGTRHFDFLIFKNGTIDVQAADDETWGTASTAALTGQPIEGQGGTAVKFQMSVVNANTTFTVKFAKGVVATRVPILPTWLHKNALMLITAGVTAGGVCFIVFVLTMCCWLKCWIFE